MKLIYTPTSPFARKVRAVAMDLKIDLELVNCACHPINRDPNIIVHNPLGQVPTLIADNGQAIYDSRVICRYLNEIADGNLIPEGDLRWQVEIEEALANGCMDAATMSRIETAMRPVQWQPWLDALYGKINDALAKFNSFCRRYNGQVDLGMISIACALGYLDFRMQEYDWRMQNSLLADWYEEFSQYSFISDTAPHV